MTFSSARLRGTTIIAAAICVAGTVTLTRSQGNEVQLILVDRQGHKTPLGSLPRNTFAPRVSPDGKRLAWDSGQTIWVADLSNLKSAHRLASGDFPLWSPNGEQIVFAAGRPPDQTLYLQSADGSGTPELIYPGRAPESWAAPNQTLSFISLAGYYSIWTWSPKDRKAAPLIDNPGVSQHSSKFSPRGDWIAWTSTENGRPEVFVRSYPLTGARFQITTQGGGHPLWSPDGKEIFFDNNGQIFAVAVQTAGTFSAAPPVALPITGFIQGPLRRQYDLMPDGKQFLMMFPS
jgi:Tol biopolymer transport system component